jgi:PIN domain nuclease of toxin-antitoxin system
MIDGRSGVAEKHAPQAEKGRIPQLDFSELIRALADPDSSLTIAPLDLAVSRAVARIPRDQVPDLPDRVVQATALVRRLPLVTRDGKVRASASRRSGEFAGPRQEDRRSETVT